MLQARLRQAWTGSLRAAACVILGTALLIAHGGGHAFAEDDDDDDDLGFEQKFIRNMMSGIGMAGTGNGIEYRERSPLVIPPGRDLPPPEADAAKPATNWPKDPEKQRKVTKKQKKPLDARETKLWDDPGRALGPAELNVGRTSTTSSSTTTAPGSSASETEGGRPLLPSMLGYTGGVFGSIWGNNTKEETATFTGEPPRTTLTAPPTGYMTPSPAQPYGIGTQRAAPAKPMNPADLPARSN